MENRAPLIASLAIAAAIVGVSAWGWLHIPADAQVAVHWGLNGKPNGYWHRDKALLLIPFIGFGLTFIFAIAPAVLPLGRNLRHAPAYIVGWLGGMLILLVAHTGIVLHAIGTQIDILRSTIFVTALLIAALGNFLGKMRRNWLVGVRTPWTLSSDYAWEKSNRLAGRLFVVTGGTALVAVVGGPRLLGVAVLIGGIGLTAAISMAASFLYWRADPERES